MSQPERWKMLYNDIVMEKACMDLSFFSHNYDEIIFFGCGSSYNLSQAAAFFTRSVWDGKNCLALPSSELLINTDAYIWGNKKYLIIGFSRSGETSESVDVVRLLKGKGNIISFTFSCKKGSPILDFSDYYFVCEGALENSVVMTSSFSSMLIGYCLVLLKFLNHKEMLCEIRHLIDYVGNSIYDVFKFISEYLRQNDFNSYFVLGSGFDYGLAVEADLKMKEMSQTPSYSYHIYEFNHGPKSLVNEESLCVILTPNKNLFKLRNVIREILRLGAKVLVSGSNTSGISHGRLSYISCNAEFGSELIKSFVNIPIFQILAYVKAIKKNLNPDKPRNLSYTTTI